MSSSLRAYELPDCPKRRCPDNLTFYKFKMSVNDLPRMSLAAQFDDICRYNEILSSGIENEFKIFAESQYQNVRKSKADAEAQKLEIQELQAEVSDLESENRRLETQIKLLKNLVQESNIKIEKVELERNSLERQILMIKDVLLADGVMDEETKEKLGFLNSYKPSFTSEDVSGLETIQESTGSLLSLSDIDRSEDDLDIYTVINTDSQQSEKRRSNSDSRISLKNKKNKNKGPLNDENGVSKSHKYIGVRCNSEPASASPETSRISQHKSDLTPFKNPLGPQRCHPANSAGNTPSRYSTGGKLSRQHDFVSKVLCRPEKCHSCCRSIGFFCQALKCQDCTVICHTECKKECPVPCVPVVHAPAEGTTGTTISDYTPSVAPMIPPLIVHCVHEIESRGLGEKGLYRVSGSEREMKILKDKFLNNRSIPLLHTHDINAVCGTIKEFLRSLSDPLITRNAWQEFVNEANLEDHDKSLQNMYNIVCSLPQPNRDTLAYLVLHLQRVSESAKCKMPVSSLAKIFGPTIIGYSVPDPNGKNVIGETKDQYKVMECLLRIPSDSWKNLLNVEPDVFMPSSLKTPENIPSPRGNRLGPFSRGLKSNSASAERNLRNSRLYKCGKMNYTLQS